MLLRAGKKEKEKQQIQLPLLNQTEAPTSLQNPYEQRTWFAAELQAHARNKDRRRLMPSPPGGSAAAKSAWVAGAARAQTDAAAIARRHCGDSMQGDAVSRSTCPVTFLFHAST
jgi:hypothetical protein